MPKEEKKKAEAEEHVKALARILRPKPKKGQQKGTPSQG